MTSTRARLPRAKVNFAENILRSHVNAKNQDRIAIHSVIEGQILRSLTWAQLDDEVVRAASALKKLGVRPGDRVAAYTANNAEAVVTLLATTAVGAIWSATPCEFGIEATLSRLHQVGTHSSLGCRLSIIPLRLIVAFVASRSPPSFCSYQMHTSTMAKLSMCQQISTPLLKICLRLDYSQWSW